MKQERKTRAIKMFYWEPGQLEARARAVTDPNEVIALAGDLLARCQSATVLPGIELRASGGETLSIAVSPQGWALIHTDSEFTQHCTKRARGDGNVSVDSKWEEVTSIPRQWFIPKPLAVIGLTQWLTDGTRSPQLPWSDQCF